MRLLPDMPEQRRRLNHTFGALAVVGALLALACLLSYDGRDPQWFFKDAFEGPARNWFGVVGATVGELLLQSFGAGAFVVALLALGLGQDRLRRWDRPVLGRAALLSTVVLSLLALLSLAYGTLEVRGSGPFPAGGAVGAGVSAALVSILNRPGAWLVALSVLVASTWLVARRSWSRVAALLAVAARSGATALAAAWARARERNKEKPSTRRPAPPPPATPVAPRPTIDLEERPAPAPPAVAAAAEIRTAAPRPTPAPAPRQQALPMDPGERGYSLPPLELLQEPEAQTIESEHELLERAQLITQKLREFAVGGAVVAVHPGPVVTTFEFRPDAGVKYSKITALNDDLSLALKAESVRIDRMPGRSTVGIEVPNRKQETIYPRELIGSERFRSARSKLALALGKDITGEGIVAELDRMPHLLIAGATGAGKSVGLNGMIVSLLYKSTPRDLRFIMIDTKMIELGIYAEIPHLLIPVVTDPKKASAALKWGVVEMESRYRKLAAVGVRNLAQFNALLEREPNRTMPHAVTGEPLPLAHLPYIVIVIDEMADLMMVTAADVEESIMRLAQMARAVGIHLILATQRPSVDVITGTIKANFPARIAYRVSQRVDSRTIIDQQGAEHLLGRGDMLFLATGASRVTRIHGGFITEAELGRITAWLKKMAQPAYDESVLRAAEDEARGGAESGERDEMYADAVRTVVQEGKCSVTLIQRRLQLGYARAARIVDMMEQDGVVGPGEGSKPREILAGPDALETLLARR